MKSHNFLRIAHVLLVLAILAFVGIPYAFGEGGYNFVSKWGTLGSGDGQFNLPHYLDVDSSGYVYVADCGNHRVQKFTSDGTFVTKWGSYGSGDGQFNQPCGIAVDSLGHVYVTDYGNHRVQKFTSDGTFVTKWGSYGSGDGQFHSPYSIAADSLGYVYVTGHANHRVQKFTSDGTFVAKWGSYGDSDGQFAYPAGIDIDSSEYVYVADCHNHRVQKFNSSGEFEHKWGSFGGGDGQFNYPTGIVVDLCGYVYLADNNNDRIQKFTSDGAFVTKWGSYGSGDGQFDSPADIAVDSSGYVYVSDNHNHRIQKFGPVCWVEQAKLLASDGAAGDFFGIDISISGDYAIIGADGDDDRGNWSGSAYIFKREGESWVEQTKLTASDGAAGDRFGLCVSMSGDYAIVGAHNTDNNGSNSGSAYIFKRSAVVGDPNWYQKTKLTASDAASLDNLGFSVSINGYYAIVGAHGDDNKTGSAYIFKRSEVLGDPHWYEQCKLTAPDRADGDYFGISVSISGDYAIVGVGLDDDDGIDSGSAYIFKRSDTPGDPNWYQESKLTASDGAAGDGFGNNAVMSGDYAIVGATGNDANGLVDSGAAYVFKRSDVPGDPNWYEQAKLTASDGSAGDGFGNRTEMSDDYAIIPAYADDTDGLENSGSAYIFRRDGTSWVEQAKLTASDAAAHDVFGAPAISGDCAIVGAPRDDENGTDSGSAYVFENVCIPEAADPVELLVDLAQDVIALNLQQGISNSLDAKLEAAMQALDDINENNDVAAINTLQAFINAVEAQRGNKISETDADALIASAQEIIDVLSME